MAGISEEVYVLEPTPESFNDRRHILGRGAFGVTQRMRNKVDKALYAVKVIRVEEAQIYGLQVKDLTREASLLQPLNHPHIVRYFTCFFSEHNMVFNVVMELVSGGSLAAKVKDASVDVDCIRRWLNQMASVLSYLHYEMRLQHRDIKPENIVLTSPGNAIKLIDLGLACVMQSTASRVSTIGTLTYSSYEKVNSIPYDGRDDVWGAGCVFAELLVKARLSERGGAIYMFHNKTVSDRRLLLIDDCVKVDVGLGSVIGRMLEPEQEHRCTSEVLVRLMTAAMPSVSVSDADISVCSDSVVHSPPLVEMLHLEISPSLVADQSLEAKTAETEFPVSSPTLEELQQHKQQHHSSGIILGINHSSSVVSSQWSEKYSKDVGSCSLVKFSPDGSVIAVAPWDSDILIFDPSGRLITTMKESSKNVFCLSFSPGGTKLASSSFENNCVKLFEVFSGRLLWSTTVNKTRQVCFINSSKLVASEGDENCFIIDVSSGSITSRISADGNVCLCVSNRGTLITAGLNAKVTIWDNLSNPCLLFGCFDVLCLCINSDGSLIYVGTMEGDILVYADSGVVIREVKKAHDDWIYSLSMNETNSLLVSGGEDKKVKLWNASTLECIQTLEGHTNWVRSVSFSPNNNTFVSGSEDKSVKVWSCYQHDDF